MNPDVIIIGAGLGGLTAGAKLSKEGKKVLIIDQHYVPGGCATNFRRKDFIMDVALHQTGGIEEGSLKAEILKDLDIQKNVEFIRIPEFYRFKNNSTDIVIPDDTEKAIKVLTERFPKEEKGIKKFFRTIHSIRNEIYKLPTERWKLLLLYPIFPLVFPNIARNLFNTLGKFLDSIINDDELKLIISANIGYYHNDPYSMSLFFFSVAQAEFFKGSYYIKGSGQQLSNYLAKVIKYNGGEVLLNNIVTKILIEKKKAIGVEFKNKLGKPILNKAFAKIIVANSAIPNVVNLLPDKESSILKKKITKLEDACSLFNIYIGFKKPIKELGNKHYSTYFYDNTITKISDFAIYKNKKPFNQQLVFVDYSQINSGLAPEGKGVGTIAVTDHMSNWENLTKEEYEKKKEQAAQIMFKRLEKYIPGITKEIECYEVATPKTIQRYTLNPSGTAYGFAQIPKQTGIFRPTNKSPIKNLYFASAWAKTGGGYSGAMLSGWYCANEILRLKIP